MLLPWVLSPLLHAVLLWPECLLILLSFSARYCVLYQDVARLCRAHQVAFPQLRTGQNLLRHASLSNSFKLLSGSVATYIRTYYGFSGFKVEGPSFDDAVCCRWEEFGLLFKVIMSRFKGAGLALLVLHFVAKCDEVLTPICCPPGPCFALKALSQCVS